MTPPQPRRSSADNPTLGEIGRLLEAFRAEAKEEFTEINRRFDRLDSTYVRKETYDANENARNIYIAGHDSRISAMESNQAWIVRIVISTVVVALIGGLFAASKMVGGP
jgi:hypothetical protein